MLFSSTFIFSPFLYFNETAFLHGFYLFFWNKDHWIRRRKYVFIVPIHKISIFINFVKIFYFLFILNDSLRLICWLAWNFLLKVIVILSKLRRSFFRSTVSDGDFFSSFWGVLVTDVWITSCKDNTGWIISLPFSLFIQRIIIHILVNSIRYAESANFTLISGFLELSWFIQSLIIFQQYRCALIFNTTSIWCDAVR